VGIWGAWLPIWLGWRSIIVLGILLLIGVFVSNRFKWFRSIHSVQRETIGEYLFPVSMIVMAIFFKNDTVFAAGMLMLGVADGLAAVVGTRYGKKSMFKVLGNKKSWHGTAAFYACSVVILAWAISVIQPGLSTINFVTLLVTGAIVLSLSAVLTIAELTGQKGIDNLTVPLLTCTALYLLS
jgi:phytol kinase